MEIYERLIKFFGKPSISYLSGSPFETLIRTIISQNTNWRNTRAAYKRLSEKFEIKPEVLAEVDIREIEEALRIAGLFRNKARVIKEVSKQIKEKFDGDLNRVLSMPIEEARKILMSLPGVGPKTADILLLFNARKPVMPVDTHIMRISKRLGLVREKAGYEEIRKTIENLLPKKSEVMLEMHLALIRLGREICKAKKPKCDVCPLNNICRKLLLRRNGENRNELSTCYSA